MNSQKIYLDLKTDREPLALLLIRAGYTVRIGDEKIANGTGKKTIYFVEYWKNI